MPTMGRQGWSSTSRRPSDVRVFRGTEKQATRRSDSTRFSARRLQYSRRTRKTPRAVRKAGENARNDRNPRRDRDAHHLSTPPCPPRTARQRPRPERRRQRRGVTPSAGMVHPAAGVRGLDSRHPRGPVPPATSKGGSGSTGSNAYSRGTGRSPPPAPRTRGRSGLPTGGIAMPEAANSGYSRGTSSRCWVRADRPEHGPALDDRTRRIAGRPSPARTRSSPARTSRRCGRPSATTRNAPGPGTPTSPGRRGLTMSYAKAERGDG